MNPILWGFAGFGALAFVTNAVCAWIIVWNRSAALKACEEDLRETRECLAKLSAAFDERTAERDRLNGDVESLFRQRDGLQRANQSLVEKWQKSAAAIADERDQARTRLLELSQAAMKLVGATEGAEIGLISDYRLVRQERGNVLEVLKTFTVLKTPEDAR